MFKSDQRLVRDMLAAIQHGERIFVVCNSKRRAKAIDKLVAKTCGDRTRRILVTADDVEEDRNVQELLGDIKTEILRYDVVIASPAIGTGVDITFPGNEQLIDTVYGFFNSQINSHYDIDQQLGRVRNPKKLKVWVSPREENFETEESVVMLDIVQNNEIEIPNVGYGDDGIEQFDCDDPLLTLLTDVYCSQRASQNRLHHYFVKHKERDGWKIVEAATEEGDEAPGPAFKEALREIEDAQHERLLCAKKIAYETYEQRSAEAAKGVSLSPTEALELERYEIEDFYQRDLTLDLIHKDDHGRLRQRVQTYENLCSAFKYGAADAELSEFLSSGHWRETLGHGTDHLLLPSIALVARVVRDGDFDLTRELERGDLAEFVDFCQRRSVTIERYLKIKIRRDIARDPVRMLNLFLSLAGQGLSIVKTTKRRGAKVYRYRLDPDRYAEIREIVDFRHAERKRRKEASLDPAAKAFFEGVARRNATYRAATHATAVSRDDGG